MICRFATPLQSAVYGLRVIDASTGVGIPLVECKTTQQTTYWSDSAGYVVIQEPGLDGEEMFLHLRSDGYQIQADGFGYQGTRIALKPNQTSLVQINRTQPAERVGRITGIGRYRDGQLLGVKPYIDWQEPSLQVAGQDSSQGVVFGQKIYWFWGDTSILRYPLGNFRTTGATSPKDVNPPLVAWSYFLDGGGLPKPMFPMFPAGDLVWVDGLCVLQDASGQERMAVHYSRIESLEKQLEHGLAAFDTKENRFKILVSFDLENQWQHLRGHPLTTHHGDQSYLQFGDVYAHIRVPKMWEAIQDPNAYESFGASKEPGEGYAWRRHLPPVTSEQESSWVGNQVMRESDCWTLSRHATTGAWVQLHRGSVRWNPYLKKYILIANQIGGSSMLGEVFYGESEKPEGPWPKVIKIASHQRMSFYNPVQRAFWDEQGGRVIYFEGTYVTTFSGHEHPMPRYDYNQLLSRLDLEHGSRQELSTP